MLIGQTSGKHALFCKDKNSTKINWSIQETWRTFMMSYTGSLKVACEFLLCKLFVQKRIHSVLNQILFMSKPDHKLFSREPLSLYCPPATAPFCPFLDNLITEKKCFYSYFIISHSNPQTAAIWLSLLLKLLLPSSLVNYSLPNWWTHLIFLFHITLSSLKLFFSFVLWLQLSHGLLPTILLTS